MQLQFYDRRTNKTSPISTNLKTTLKDIYPSIHAKFDISNQSKISIYCTKMEDGQFSSCIFNQDTTIKELEDLVRTRKVKRFEVYYKDTQHGKQEADMSPVKNGTVISGYKRFVNKDGNETIVGDTNGAYITIPKGALANSTTISIKTVNTNLTSGVTNVTKGVGYNTKANDNANNY
uniref:Uncharacterized protein n=1 Tax=Megaviridae environmental sample TaxID=1737588 RepID=A0A5J6VK97_9VIRU|nr:MAG: hypothetical protein [Megaviridae environmental sample]